MVTALLLHHGGWSYLGPAASTVGRPIPFHYFGDSAAASDEVGVGGVDVR